MNKWEKMRGKAITACGGILTDSSKYPFREYRGARIHFCNRDCLREFEEDPELFMSGKVLHPVARQKE